MGQSTIGGLGHGLGQETSGLVETTPEQRGGGAAS